MATNNTSNGTPSRVWAGGPSVPLVTAMNDDESINYDALAKQTVRLAKAGLGIVLLGTNGEASHLSPEERKQCTIVVRKALDDAGFVNEPLLVGTGAGSAQTTIQVTKEAAAAGASHAIVITPGYFSFAMGRDRKAIKDFFRKVFDESPIPVMIYNFPGAAAGIDLTSDEIIELSNHPNCFGVKLTCAMIGKGHRIAAYTQSPEYLAKHGSFLKSCTATGQFQVLPGFSESTLPALVSRHTGCITGTGNTIPKTIRRLWDKSVAGLQGDSKALAEAMELQDRVAEADWTIVKAGIQGTKYFLDHYVEKGLGGAVRLPLGAISDDVKKLIEVDLKSAWEFEQSL
ncbi:dihydrodipicolinate synthase [Cryptococcus deuterogattii 99/473]|uniref:Dihydrodipicolinate synthase n=2 Tax=Cryptococcus deuterogattii TaxID=1859096 RepID=A0A0D0V9E6_9TREE|nr:dihydrodipicolinate synthase [Cryptococcus deuterogattii R265]KIR29137.1 dihydrodipicolinate synthase [Cryptococcus deuterogattii LA55]KIR34185.1 dihydrodipicolinate synthase [Cryptococcus deuterogattii MMRL2647]KIR41430.1 dihydrodipicolinate synthase [Cryptococcus deuterogattii Ram5]KIR71672.1 dihydrodipicolinate synthase [Cryptococcus deuterogattii CA1014]KIR91255.1 dihydrodipicolinate synthase [Cryptococcus deuterogattii CBS 10090]KIR98557.1 dihydrodipicolinate synthase [Cryptococcus de